MGDRRTTWRNWLVLAGAVLLAGAAQAQAWGFEQVAQLARQRAAEPHRTAPADLPAALAASRELVRRMGAESGVPIEPESQTELIDALSAVEGVFGGVVPGAGGFDAVAVLMRDDRETLERVEEFLKGWSEKKKASKVKLLGVKGELEGARMEKLSEFDGWL